MAWTDCNSKILYEKLDFYSNNVITNNNGQASVSTTIYDLINVMSALPAPHIEAINEDAHILLEKYLLESSRGSDFNIHLKNLINDLTASYEGVIKIINKKGFFANIFNAVGVYKADEIIRAFHFAEYGNEIVLLSIYPLKNKFRFYGWWSPLCMASVLCCLALEDFNLLPKRFKVLIEKGRRIEEEIVVKDYLGKEEALSNKLNADFYTKLN